MKRVCFFIIALLASIASLYAQSEVKGDSVRSLPDGTPPDGVFLPETKNYNGFLLDMSLMKMEAPRLPEFTLEIPDASKDYSSIFRLNPDVTYSQGLSNVFSLTNSTVYSMNPFGLTGFWSSPENLQMGSFKLKTVCVSIPMANMTKTAGKFPTARRCHGRRTTSRVHSR